MALVNPNIALSVQQFQVPNKLGMAAEAEGIQNMQVSRQAALQEMDRAQYTHAISQSKEALRFVQTPDQYLSWMESSFNDPVIGGMLKQMGVDPSQARSQVMAELQQPGGLERAIQRSTASVAELGNIMGQRVNAIEAQRQAQADRAAAAREQAVIQGIISGQGAPAGANALATGGGAPTPPRNALAAPPSAPAGASIMTPEATAAAPAAPAAVPTMSEVVAQQPTQADQLLTTIGQLRQAAAAGVKGAAAAADQLQKQYDLETKQSDPTKRFLNVGNGVVFDTQTQSYIQNPEGKTKTGTPVAVLDEESGSVVLVSPEEAIGRTPGSQAEKIPKDFRKKPDGSLEIIPGSPTDMKNKENASVGIKTIDAAIGNIDKLIGPVGNLKEHPGLRSATGPIDVKTPTLFESTANAEAYIESLQAKASLEGLRTIRGQAGAIGQITEKEWPRLENLLATLQAKQGTNQFIQSLNEYREALLDVKRQISAAEAAGGGGTNIDALLEKYK